jgi:deoxyribonuclease IV
VPERAHGLGAEVVQVFSSNPRMWPRQAPRDEDVRAFVLGLRHRRLPLFLHTIYLINLATPDDALRRRSVETLASSLVLGAVTEAAGVVTHVGSHRGDGLEQGSFRVATAIREAADLAARSLAASGIEAKPAPLLLENSAGAGRTLGGTLEELAGLLAAVPPALEGTSFGICLDTAHLFAAGYPLHEAEGLEELVGRLTGLELLPRLGLVHLNDSATPFASRRDQHHNPGTGQIGYDALARVVRHPALARVPFVLETPGAEGHGPDVSDIAVVKAMRAGKSWGAAVSSAKAATRRALRRGSPARKTGSG